MRLEWESIQKQIPPNTEIVSIYFGGGTPSLLPAFMLQEILSWTRKFKWTDDCEITIEANPENAFFSEFYKIGINRVSIGVQSLDDNSLESLERTHSAQKAKEAIWSAFDSGIKNISIDLMYDLPNQTEASWRRTLNELKSLPIQHLSLYNLTIEPHTSFFKRKIKTPPAALSLRFLSLALSEFEKIGLARYEISAFAKNKNQSKHNLGYWTYRPFFGLGPSAFSYWNEERFQNIPRLHQYVESLKKGLSPVHFREKLVYPSNVLEKLTVGLRLKNGVSLMDNLPSPTRSSLIKLEQEGLLLLEDSYAKLTDKGMLVYDEIASYLI